jgi:hypothetical protein
MDKIFLGIVVAIMAIFILDFTSVLDEMPPRAESQPATSIASQNASQTAVQITEDEFSFDGVLERSGDEFVGTDGRVRVRYLPSTGQVIVTDEATGQTLYDYFVSSPQGNISAPANSDGIPALW